MAARYALDEVVDVTLRGARVGRQIPSGSPSYLVLEHDGTGPIQVDLTRSDITVERVAPGEWPPQPGDVWEDGGGDQWFAREIEGEGPYLTSAGNRTEVPDYVLAQRGPMTLAYRKGWTPAPAADVDQADEPERDERAATIAGLRELADFIESHPELPLPKWGLTFGGSMVGAGEVKGIKRAAEVLGVDLDPRQCGPKYWRVLRAFGPVEVVFSYCDGSVPDPAIDVPPSPPEEVAEPMAAGAATATWPEEAEYWTEDADGDPVIPKATAPEFELGPDGEHYMASGTKGGPGECGAECKCGVGFYGFDTLREAVALLDEHIADPDPRDSTLTDEQIDGAVVALAEAIDANPELLDAPAVETDAALLDQLGVAVTGADELALELDRPGYSDKVRTWLFSFGAGQQYDGRYVLIRDTGERARKEMIAHFGLEWCEQYRSSSANAAMVRDTCAALPREEWPRLVFGAAVEPADTPGGER